MACASVRLMSAQTTAAPSDLAHRIDTAAAAIEQRVTAWRRDLHQHPELGNRETRTASIVAEQLRGQERAAGEAEDAGQGEHVGPDGTDGDRMLLEPRVRSLAALLNPTLCP